MQWRQKLNNIGVVRKFNYRSMTNLIRRELWLARISDWVGLWRYFSSTSFFLSLIWVGSCSKTGNEEHLHIRVYPVALYTEYLMFVMHFNVSKFIVYGNEIIRIEWKILMVCHIYLPSSNPLFYSIKLRTSLFKFPCQNEDSHKQLFTYSANFILQFWRMWLKGTEMKYDEIRSRKRVNAFHPHFKISIKM